MNFLGKRKQRPRCEARMFKGEVYLPSLRAGPTEWISLSSVFRSQRGERSDVITLTKPRETITEKYVDPCNRDTIRSNCLAHYDHSRQTTIREWSESFLLQKRSENTIILVSAMRKRERCDCTCGSYGVMEYRDLFSFCDGTYLPAASSHFSSRVCEFTLIPQTYLFVALRPYEDYYSYPENLFIMILSTTSGVFYSLLSGFSYSHTQLMMRIINKVLE